MDGKSSVLITERAAPDRLTAGVFVGGRRGPVVERRGEGRLSC